MSNRLTQTLIYFIITISVQEGGLPQTFSFLDPRKKDKNPIFTEGQFLFFLRKVDKNPTLPNKHFFSFSFSQRTITQSNQFFFFYQDKRTRIQLYHAPRFLLFLFFYLFLIIFLLSTKKYIHFHYENQILTFN